MAGFKMSPCSTTWGLDQPRGNWAIGVSLRHIRPSLEVKNRWARDSSQITQKSIQLLTCSGLSSNKNAGAVHEEASAIWLDVEKAGR